jgi:hypothetical protein
MMLQYSIRLHRNVLLVGWIKKKIPELDPVLSPHAGTFATWEMVQFQMKMENP